MLKKLIRLAFRLGPIVLLVGSLLIGLVTGERGWATMEPVFGVPFKGVLILLFRVQQKIPYWQYSLLMWKDQ